MTKSEGEIRELADLLRRVLADPDKVRTSLGDPISVYTHRRMDGALIALDWVLGGGRNYETVCKEIELLRKQLPKEETPHEGTQSQGE